MRLRRIKGIPTLCLFLDIIAWNATRALRPYSWVIRKWFALFAPEKILKNFFLPLAIRVRENFQDQRNLPAVLVAPPVVIPVAHYEKVC